LQNFIIFLWINLNKMRSAKQPRPEGGGGGKRWQVAQLAYLSYLFRVTSKCYCRTALAWATLQTLDIPSHNLQLPRHRLTDGWFTWCGHVVSVFCCADWSTIDLDKLLGRRRWWSWPWPWVTFKPPNTRNWNDNDIDSFHMNLCYIWTAHKLHEMDYRY